MFVCVIVSLLACLFDCCFLVSVGFTYITPSQIIRIFRHFRNGSGGGKQGLHGVLAAKSHAFVHYRKYTITK